MQTLIRPVLVAIVVIASSTAFGGRPGDVTLRHGDLVVVNEINEQVRSGGVYRVDPTTGDRAVLSQAGVRGEGISFFRPLWAAFANDGNILVTDYGLFGAGAHGALIEVDRLTGDRRVLSGLGVGSGPEFDNPFGIVVADDAIYVTNQGHANTLHGDLLRVDPITGDRRVVVALNTPTGMDRDAKGTFWIADPELDSVIAVEPGRGVVRTIGGFEHPLDVAVQPDGTLAVGDLFLHGIFRVNPATGAKSLISGRDRGDGPMDDWPEHVTAGLSGELLVGDPVGGAVWRVDPVSGDRFILSGMGVGGGPELETVRDVIVVTPEPTLAGAAAILLPGAACLRQRRR